MNLGMDGWMDVDLGLRLQPSRSVVGVVLDQLGQDQARAKLQEGEGGSASTALDRRRQLRDQQDDLERTSDRGHQQHYLFDPTRNHSLVHAAESAGSRRTRP